MRRHLISSIAVWAFVLAASESAFAADMAVKAPAPIPAPVYNWTGLYVGVNAGASMGEAKTNLNGSPVFSTNTGFPGQITSGFGVGNDPESPNGFIGGGQIGYNWQYSPLIVVGLEADLQGSLEKAEGNITNNVNFIRSNFASVCGTAATTNFFDTPCTAATNYSTQIDWFGTARARLGYVWGNGGVLTYVTGGLAYGEVKINGTNTVSGPVYQESVIHFSETQTIDASHVNTGWVLGFGTEGKTLIPGLTLKMETLYMDLGPLNATSVASDSSCMVFNTGRPCAVNGGQVVTHTHFTDWILRAGVNYQLH